MQVSSVRLWGYGMQIEQPALDNAKATCGEDRLQYSDSQLASIGQRAHDIVHALAISDRGAIFYCCTMTSQSIKQHAQSVFSIGKCALKLACMLCQRSDAIYSSLSFSPPTEP